MCLIGCMYSSVPLPILVRAICHAASVHSGRTDAIAELVTVREDLNYLITRPARDAVEGFSLRALLFRREGIRRDNGLVGIVIVWIRRVVQEALAFGGG